MTPDDRQWLTTLLNQRFGEIDRRFVELETRLNERIEATETKLLTAFQMGVAERH